MKKTKFATNPVAKKIKVEAKIRKSNALYKEMGIDETVKQVSKYPMEEPNKFLLGLVIGVVGTITLISVHSLAMGL
jgi:hypothetical protein